MASCNTGEAVDEEVALTREHLDGITHLLASLARACRLGDRRAGTLEVWLTRVKQMGIPLQGPLSYLLQVGEAIFSFCLVLWELVLMVRQPPRLFQSQPIKRRNSASSACAPAGNHCQEEA